MASRPATFQVRFEYALTVPPHERAIVMHFLAREGTRAAATAKAQGLVALPPAALSGLSAEERAAIVNFAVPTAE